MGNQIAIRPISSESVFDIEYLKLILGVTEKTSQQTQNICTTFVQRRPNVIDVGPTLYKYYTNVLCLPGSAEVDHGVPTWCAVHGHVPEVASLDHLH